MEKEKKTLRELYPAAYIIADNIRALSARYGTTDADIARVMRGSLATVSRRKHEPWRFTVDELTDIAKLWSMTPEQLMIKPKYEVVPKTLWKEG